MPLYEADGTKQKPIARTGRSFLSHATCPTNEEIVKVPSYVNINSQGTYAFAYDSASAALGTSTTNYITGSVVDDGAGPIRLDISPVAWRQVDGANVGGDVGDVTFVYVRVI